MITYLLIHRPYAGPVGALGEDRRVTIDVTFRDLEPSDLGDLAWSGGFGAPERRSPRCCR